MPETDSPVLDITQFFDLTTEFEAREVPPHQVLIPGLLNKGDQIALGAKKRHGKTGFVINLAYAGAYADRPFLGRAIPEPFKTCLFLVEDDLDDLHKRTTTMFAARPGTEEQKNRVTITIEDHLLSQGIRPRITNSRFKTIVRRVCEHHKPDLIVLDNMAILVKGNYNNSEAIEDCMSFSRDLSNEFGAAVLLPAHIRKGPKEEAERVRLSDEPELWQDEIMGSSHFTNRSGSIWGLERPDPTENVAMFLGGRQRGENNPSLLWIEQDDDGWLQVSTTNLQDQVNAIMQNNVNRLNTWIRLPHSFTFTEGFDIWPNKSRKMWVAFLTECENGRILIHENNHYRKAI